MTVKSFTRAFIALVGIASAIANPVRRSACPGSTHTAINSACCVWFDVLDDVQANLLGGDCGEEVHESLRLTFHDAIGFSPALTQAGQFGGGGADGSIILFEDIEETFAANLGTQDMADTQRSIADAHGVSYGDIIQFIGAVGLSQCAGAPQISFFAGRPNATAASPPGLLPDPFNPTDQILDRFADAGFSPDEVVALLASHSVAAQDHVQPDVHGSPFDSTFDTFDNQFFIEIQLKGILNPSSVSDLGDGELLSPLPGELRLQSDAELARDPRTACTWQSLAADQNLMVSKFQAAMNKLAVLGQDVSSLTDCTEVIPIAAPNNVAPHLPAGKTMADIEQACTTAAFPSLPTIAGPLASVAPVPP